MVMDLLSGTGIKKRNLNGTTQVGLKTKDMISVSKILHFHSVD